MAIDSSAAHLSDTLFTTSIAVYALATISYAGEYAFGLIPKYRLRTLNDPAQSKVAGNAKIALMPAGMAPTPGPSVIAEKSKRGRGPKTAPRRFISRFSSIRKL